MKKISKKLKVNMVKAYILFVFAWMCLFIFVGFRVECNLNPEWKVLFWIIFFIYVVLVFLMIYLMGKIDIAPVNVEPIVKKITTKEYSQFKQIIFSEARKKGFNEMQELYVDDSFKTSLASKKIKDAIYVLQTVWMENFDATNVEKATELFWEKTVEQAGDVDIQYQSVCLIQCICVQRINNEFRKYVTQNVQQGYKRYQILMAISFGGRKAYICQTKGGFFRSYYQGLKALLDDLTRAIFLTKE